MARITEGLGKAKPEEEWKQIHQEKWPRKYLGNIGLSPNALIACPVCADTLTYMGCKDNSCSLESVIDLALEKWQVRL